ncbi:MAG: ATP-dependent RNA helicase DbpA [Myxococcales bacterium]|nr:ATP-dependent RNA helicase DbpA [Myxococcales bacterium]
MPSFADLGLPEPLARATTVLGFDTLTPIQAHSVPVMLAGQDVIAQATTGSGKTVAFGLGVLARVRPEDARVQALVLCPTRELAEQVSGELRRLARFIPNVKLVTLCGGVPVRTQTPSLVPAPQIVVGTPGRLLDHLRRDTLDLSGLQVLVLDEADRMLDMGFLDAIDDVVKAAPRTRQTFLFSATYTDEVRQVSRRFQTKPAEITVAAHEAAPAVRQVFHEVSPEERLTALRSLLLAAAGESALVFCHTRKDTREVAAALRADGFAALALHGELEQRERDEVLLRFAHRSCTILVATDVAARGLDIKGLPLVISWELPLDPHIHVHRIGRTGRAGQEGLALALCAPGERDRAAAIALPHKQALSWEPLPPLPENRTPPAAPRVTWVVEGGRQDKLRPGDLLGAFVAEFALTGDAVGKIDVVKERAYISLAPAFTSELQAKLKAGQGKVKVKGKLFRMSLLADPSRGRS